MKTGATVTIFILVIESKIGIYKLYKHRFVAQFRSPINWNL